MKSFPVLGSSIEFPPPAERYRDSFVRFADLADTTRIVFEVQYETLKEPGECLSAITSGTAYSIQCTAEAAVTDLAGRGLYDTDEEAFLERFRRALDGSAAWQVFSEVIASLPEMDDEDDASVAPFIGGGFGVEGALQGMAIATAANLATGLVSGAFNNLKREGIRKDAQNHLTDPATIRQLSGAVRDIVLLGHDVMIDILMENGVEDFDRPTLDEKRKARAIIRNVGSGRVPDEALPDALATALKLNPYDPAPFVLLHSRGHWSSELDALSSFLEIDVADAAEMAAVTELVGEKAASRVATLESGIKAILAKHSNRDLYVEPNIPSRKEHNASEAFFNMATSPAPECDSEPPIDPGQMIGLIDCTVFGRADSGIAFGSNALAWRQAFTDPAQIPWGEFRGFRDQMTKTLHGVMLAGSELSLAGADLKRDELILILNEIGDLLDSRAG